METRIKEKLQNELIMILDEIDRLCKRNNLNYFLIGGTLLGSIRHKGFIPWDDDIDIAMPRNDFEKFIHIANKELDKNFFLDYETTNKNYWSPFAKVKMRNTAYVESNVKKNLSNCCLWVDVFPLDYTQNNNKSKLEKRKNIIRKIYSILYNKNAKTIKDFDSTYKKIAYLLLFIIPNKILYSYRNYIMTKENKKQCDYYVNFGSQYSINKQTHKINKIMPLTTGVFNQKNYMIPQDSDYVLKNIYGQNYMQLPPIEKQVTHNPKYIKFLDGEEKKFDEEI